MLEDGSIRPDSFGLPPEVRQRLRRFVQSTCNFNPVAFDPNAAVIDVGLKIDAAPWSMSANYESEGAIAWSPPAACPDPWGGSHHTIATSKPGAYGSCDSTNRALLNELREKQHNSLYQAMQRDRITLPIWNMQHDIVKEIEHTQVVLVHGATGCGKTTQIPQFLLDYYIGKRAGTDCNIVITQPRRVAALSVAERVAQERGEPLGKSVG